MAALARGGRTNFYGFVLRLAARIPFLFIAGRMYGDDMLGRFAAALVVVELASQVAVLGQKRGLAQQLSEDDHRPPAYIVADAMALSIITSLLFTVLLLLFPEPMFPNGRNGDLAWLMPLSILPFALTEVALAACAYRYDIGATVRSRALVEPWAISIGAGALFFVVPDSGLEVAYMISILAASIAAFLPAIRHYGLPRGWSPHPVRVFHLAMRNLPLAGADAVEWGTRKLDLAILAQFATPAQVGVYFAVQQVATLAQKLKTSFDPILGPVITSALKLGDRSAIARQVSQVGFWIVAMQAGVALALAIPGEAVMGLLGPDFVSGTGALSILLVAEVVAALAVVSEAALVYIARKRNLIVSLATIAFQAVLTVGFMLAIDAYDLPEYLRMPAAALALAISLAGASIAKSVMLSRILGEPVNNLRWGLVIAAIPAAAVGWVATLLPEWLELLVGIPAILLTYGAIIWFIGFREEDRVLFRRNISADDAAKEDLATDSAER
ncbi:MAG: lipopolysaccharide biosynthesis protein [Erythrobacter sp.]|nr:lipopolysaccharide biosynthesis protein [Erythrobacter sp.]NCQ62993.1 lipopolysaccharide biosynthesis protein [Alphaproteobacteria bacterium]